MHGEFVVLGEEAASPREEALLPRALNPCFKICDLCAMQGVNTHKHMQYTQPFLCLPLLGSRGQTVSWELESQ